MWHHGMFGRHKRLESAWTSESNFDSCGFQVLNGIFQGVHAVSSTQLFPCHDVRRFEVIQRWYCARNLVHHEVIKDHKGTSLGSLFKCSSHTDLTQCSVTRHPFLWTTWVGWLFFPSPYDLFYVFLVPPGYRRLDETGPVHSHSISTTTRYYWYWTGSIQL